MKITIDFDLPIPELRRKFDGETWIDQTEIEALKSMVESQWEVFCLKAGNAVKKEIEKI